MTLGVFIGCDFRVSIFLQVPASKHTLPDSPSRTVPDIAVLFDIIVVNLELRHSR